MNYNEVVNYIDHSMKFSIVLGLERIKNLLELLGNPHHRLKCIHIAGTNGKGSTTAMVANILKCAGYKVGVYISPQLYRMTERMTIGGEEISQEDFTYYASAVIDKMNEMKAMGLEEPTQFEMLTAMMFLYFDSEKVDFAVIEVGLGGKYDATNIIHAAVSVITSISMDHMDILGDTIEKIAGEKAGIIKSDSVTVLYPQLFSAAEKVVETICREKNAKLVKVSAEAVIEKDYDTFGQSFDYCTSEFCMKDIKLALIGDHQLKNGAVAISVIKEIGKLGYNISEDSIRQGMSTVIWPCRLSIVKRKPLILIDGAHNEDGVNALKKALSKYFSDKRIIFVIGMLQDKDYKYAIAQLMPMAYRAVATEPQNYRALEADEMGDLIKPYCSKVHVEADVNKAIDKAIEQYREGDLICICGSLYLAGYALAYVNDEQA